MTDSIAMFPYGLRHMVCSCEKNNKQGHFIWAIFVYVWATVEIMGENHTDIYHQVSASAITKRLPFLC